MIWSEHHYGGHNNNMIWSEQHYGGGQDNIMVVTKTWYGQNDGQRYGSNITTTT